MPEKHYSFNTKTLEGILTQMVVKGEVVRIKKGLYRIPNQDDLNARESQKTLF